MREKRLYLTKSDFKVARTCATKLYYKKLKYPSLLEDNPFLEFLADGGYMVETMAKRLYPEGREIGHWGDPPRAFEETRQALNSGDCTLFEATVIYDQLLARVDILRREGNVLHLIEVKSSSVNTEEDDEPFRGARGGISSRWRPYLEDVTFQAVVLGLAFPEMEVHPWLCLVDKAKTATSNCTFDRFRLVRADEKEGAWRPTVTYSGDPALLIRENVLTFEDISPEVAELRAEVKKEAARFAAGLASGKPARIAPVLTPKCKKCEYRLKLNGEGKSGFNECWQTLAQADPHILDLYRVDLLDKAVFEGQLSSGDASLKAIPEDALNDSVTGLRQAIQLQHTTAGTEYISESLPPVLASHAYPLHFIDFEASRCALPYHEGMHPYELAAFQWSCHTIQEPGAPLKHNEWLNAEEAFPNFAFARALKDKIGDRGTVYTWSHYERTTLREILAQMERYGEDDSELEEWLDRLTSDRDSRLVDLMALAKEHYFHPAMKGSLSIKYVLPAVWEADPALRARAEFAAYERTENGRLLSPYDTLPALPFGDEEEPQKAVKEGIGAVRTYQDMMFGSLAQDEARKDTYRKLLLQYCGLDTAAMVMIWMHWMEHAPPKRSLRPSERLGG